MFETLIWNEARRGSLLKMSNIMCTTHSYKNFKSWYFYILHKNTEHYRDSGSVEGVDAGPAKLAPWPGFMHTKGKQGEMNGWAATADGLKREEGQKKRKKRLFYFPGFSDLLDFKKKIEFKVTQL